MVQYNYTKHNIKVKGYKIITKNEHLAQASHSAISVRKSPVWRNQNESELMMMMMCFAYHQQSCNICIEHASRTRREFFFFSRVYFSRNFENRIVPEEMMNTLSVFHFFLMISYIISQILIKVQFSS